MQDSTNGRDSKSCVVGNKQTSSDPRWLRDIFTPRCVCVVPGPLRDVAVYLFGQKNQHGFRTPRCTGSHHVRTYHGINSTPVERYYSR